MRKKVRAALETWAIAYRDTPNTLPRYPMQVLAVLIHDKMSDGQWRTATAIALEVNENLHSVRAALLAIGKHWGYESHRKKGYRRLN
jgi:hypothetical protein